MSCERRSRRDPRPPTPCRVCEGSALGLATLVHSLKTTTTSVQLKIHNPPGGGRIHANPNSNPLIVECMDRGK